MGHSHGAHPVPTHIRRRLLLATVPVALATLVGLVWLWPGSEPRSDREPDPRFGAVVTGVDPEGCSETAEQPGFTCLLVSARLEDGPDKDDTITFTYSTRAREERIEAGQQILVSRPEPVDPDDLPPGTPPPPEYYFADFARGTPLVVLASLFVLAVIAMTHRPPRRAFRRGCSLHWTVF